MPCTGRSYSEIVNVAVPVLFVRSPVPVGCGIDPETLYSPTVPSNRSGPLPLLSWAADGVTICPLTACDPHVPVILIEGNVAAGLERLVAG
jgi:hypothetical protein